LTRYLLRLEKNVALLNLEWVKRRGIDGGEVELSCDEEGNGSHGVETGVSAGFLLDDGANLQRAAIISQTIAAPFDATRPGTDR
jgi:hypothetical protein